MIARGFARAALHSYTVEIEAGPAMKRFHSFQLDVPNQALWHGDIRVALTPKAFGVLRYLVEHAGRLVSQEELLEALWPDTYVNPEVLRKYVLEIRKVLGDRPEEPAFIETRPKRGYQFVAPVIDESAAGRLPEKGTKRLVGREPALAELSSYLSQARRNERQVVFITGEPGIGKTALADEFQRRARIDGVRVARGQCIEGYGGKEAYYPILEALGYLCKGSEGESVIQILATQAPTWLVQFPALVDTKQRQMLLQEIVGATRERMLREIGDALEALASAQPFLVVLEDLHWVDPSTVDLISAVARRRAPAKLMFIGTYRPAEPALAEHPLKTVRQDLLMHRLCRAIALEPLTESEVAEYLTIDSAGIAVLAGLVQLIYRQTEGNPLFIVAALEHMKAQGLIDIEKGSWRVKVPLERVELEVPESLRQMIELQIDRLGEDELQVLEVASVTGALFTAAVRAGVANIDEERFEDLCQGMARRHQIVRLADAQEFPDGTRSASYEFVHSLYREVLYNRQPQSRRAKLHLRVAERLEALYALRPSEAAAELAQHFEKGGDWLRAIKYLQHAADTAGRRYEPRQAGDILQHALELVKKLPDAQRSEHETEIIDRLAKIYIAWVRKATGM